MNGSGNAFVADDNGGAAPGPWVEIRWLSPRHLLVQFDERAEVFKQDESVMGVRIEYQGMPR